MSVLIVCQYLLSVCPCPSLSIRLSFLSVFLFIYPFFYLFSVFLFIYPFFYLFSVCRFVYLFMSIFFSILLSFYRSLYLAFFHHSVFSCSFIPSKESVHLSDWCHGNPTVDRVKFINFTCLKIEQNHTSWTLLIITYKSTFGFSYVSSFFMQIRLIYY